MGTYNHTTTVKVLSILRDYDDAGASFVQIEQAAPEIADVRRVINNLKAQNMAYSTREHNGGALYYITSDGRRVMKRYDAPEVEMGQMPAPRERISTALYRGEKAIAVRPGAMDAFALPSRRGETFAEHRPPISMGPQA